MHSWMLWLHQQEVCNREPAWLQQRALSGESWMSEHKQSGNQLGSYIAYGVALGTGIGVSVGAAFGNVALGVALGPAFGIALAIAMWSARSGDRASKGDE